MSVITPYPANVRLVVDGEPVNAIITNRPTSDLVDRTDHLKQVLYSAVAGQAFVYHDLPCETSATPGDSVYIDTDDVVKRALIAVGVNGHLTPSSSPIGILLTKSSSQLCDVVAGGRVIGLSTSAWAPKFDTGVFASGSIYLSQSTPGKITTIEGLVSSFIGTMTAGGELFVQIKSPYQDQHLHFEAVLAGTPAGTVVDPAVGTTHVITSPNTALAGWLPANNTYFPSAVIPGSAKFGYNLAHSSASGLLAVFPPLLSSTVSVLADGTEIPSYVIVDSYGIWWVNDAYGQAPWPTDYIAGGVPPVFRIRFIKSTAGNSATAVTNLRPDPASPVPIQVLDDLSGGSGTKGNLRLYIPGLGLTQVNDASIDGYAVRTITGQTMYRNKAVSRLIAGLGVSLSGTHGDISGWCGDVTIGLAGSGSYLESRRIGLGAASVGSYSGVDTTQLPAGINVNPLWLLSRTGLGTVSIRVDVIASADAVASIPFGWSWKPILESATTWITTSTAVVSAGANVLANSYSSTTAVDIASGTGNSWAANSIYSVYFTFSLASLSPSLVQGVVLRLTRNGASDGLAGSLHVLAVNYLMG